MNHATSSEAPISLWALLRSFLIIGAISFGGGIIAYIHEYLVKHKKYITEDEFISSLALSQTLPGLIAINLSVIIGDKLRGCAGALVATLGMMLPGTIIILTLGLSYFHYSGNRHVEAFLMCVAAAGAGVMFKVTLEIGALNLKALIDLLIVIITFIAVGILHFPLVLVLITVAPIAIWIHRPRAENKH